MMQTSRSLEDLKAWLLRARGREKCFILNEIGGIYEAPETSPGEVSESEKILLGYLSANEEGLRFVAYCFLKRKTQESAIIATFEMDPMNKEVLEVAAEQMAG